MRKTRTILTSLLLSVLVAASGYDEAAAASITVETAGTAAYSIKAVDLQESAGMDLSILYDIATLKDPKVTSGALISGALMVPNTSTPGYIRIGIATGGVIKGTGELVSITFTKAGNAPAPIPTVSASVFNAAGSQLAVQSVKSPQLQDKDKTGEAGSIIAPEAGSAGAETVLSTPNQIPVQTAATVGSVSLSQETGSGTDPALLQGSRVEERREEPAPPVVTAVAGQAAEAAAPVARKADAATEAKISGILAALESSQGVLDRFRTDKGVRTLKRLSSLFDRGDLRAAGVVQSPAIVVSDGKSLVTITVELPHEVDTPSFTLKGANLKSIRRVSDRKWELVALPQKGKYDVRLSILLKGEHAEVPLVSVPPAGKAVAVMTALPAAALDALLAKPVTNNKPSYDLNSDGRQDYLDDYILIGHRLLKQQQSVDGAGRKPAAAGK